MWKAFFLIIISCTFILSCCRQESTTVELFEEFHDKKNLLDRLVVDLRKGSDTLFNYENALNKPGNVPPEIGELIKNIGITEIINYWDTGCFRINQYDLKTNWNIKYPIHISFNSCNTVETQKGFYRKDENSNEFWGLGNNWSMWREVKLTLKR